MVVWLKARVKLVPCAGGLGEQPAKATVSRIRPTKGAGTGNDESKAGVFIGSEGRCWAAGLPASIGFTVYELRFTSRFFAIFGGGPEVGGDELIGGLVE